MWIDANEIEARLTVGLPALGRRIAGYEAAALLCEDIPQLVARTLTYQALDQRALIHHVQTFEDAEALRGQLARHNLVTFIAAGACLPRQSGIDERPLRDQAALFVPPEAHCLELETVHNGRIKGLGIQKGVSLIVGGGYHGKSTLLRAIEQGIYNHVPGDGREQVVTETNAVKLRAEDGRSVVGVNISAVINHLPQGRQSDHFSTTNASGSTSQAAGLMEAIEAGAGAIFIDEDTAATNFMIRDHNMQALISKDKEPITPFVDKVRQLYDEQAISTILVMGGSGDYFAVADTVIAMQDYQPQVVTQQAKAIAQADGNRRQPEGGQRFGEITPRAVLADSLPVGKKDRPLKIKARPEMLMLGYEEVDLRAVEQIAEVHQIRAIAHAIRYAQQYYFDGQRSLSSVLDNVMEDIRLGSLDVLSHGIGSDGSDSSEKTNTRLWGDLAEFRRFELAAAINRLRTLKTQPLWL